MIEITIGAIIALVLIHSWALLRIHKITKRMRYEMTTLYDDIDEQIDSNRKVVYLGRSDKIRKDLK